LPTLHVPLGGPLGLGGENFDAAIKSVPESDRDRLVADGLMSRLPSRRTSPCCFARGRLIEAGAEAGEIAAFVDRANSRGRIERRRCAVCAAIGWRTGARRCPGAYRFPKRAASP
ncbi:MAG: hypothetical protein ACREDA_12880, partial [Methylocella sp.]